MAPPTLPEPVAVLAAQLAELPGAVAVVLGGSRATGAQRPESDWDLGLYYRRSQRPLNPDDIRGLGYEGQVSELGEWGPIMHGGAWLTVETTPVDVLFRELDTIEAWVADARDGRFEILWQNGYVVGAPTYLPVGELALCAPISGELPRPEFPRALASAAPTRWQGRAAVALMFADSYARAGDVVCCTGMLANAVLATAHARLAQRSEWVLNEKRLVARADLERVQDLFAQPADDLVGSVDAVRTALEAKPVRPR